LEILTTLSIALNANELSTNSLKPMLFASISKREAVQADYGVANRTV